MLLIIPFVIVGNLISIFLFSLVEGVNSNGSRIRFDKTFPFHLDHLLTLVIFYLFLYFVSNKIFKNHLSNHTPEQVPAKAFLVTFLSTSLYQFILFLVIVFEQKEFFKLIFVLLAMIIWFAYSIKKIFIFRKKENYKSKSKIIS